MCVKSELRANGLVSFIHPEELMTPTCVTEACCGLKYLIIWGIKVSEVCFLSVSALCDWAMPFTIRLCGHFTICWTFHVLSNFNLAHMYRLLAVDAPSETQTLHVAFTPVVFLWWHILRWYSLLSASHHDPLYSQRSKWWMMQIIMERLSTVDVMELICTLTGSAWHFHLYSAENVLFYANFSRCAIRNCKFPNEKPVYLCYMFWNFTLDIVIALSQQRLNHLTLCN